MLPCYPFFKTQANSISLRVTKYREQNKMDAHNLAVVFGPTLIRVSEEDDMISSQGHFNKVLETIIKSYDLVFDRDGLDPVDTVDEFDDDDEEEEAQKTEDEISRDEAEDSDSEDGKVVMTIYRFNILKRRRERTSLHRKKKKHLGDVCMRPA